MKLILVRHGQTDRNINPHLIGKGETPLNATGIQQAERVAQRLSREQLDYIFSSTQLRAKQTAAILKHFHPKVPYQETAEIRERDSGVTKHWTIANRDAAEKASGRHYRDWQPPEGESLRDMKKRAEQWFNRMRIDHENDAILAVTHGLFLYALMEVAIAHGAEVERDDFHHANAAVTILDVPKVGEVKVIHLADEGHLHE